MGADAMEALSQCTALRVLKLHGELRREDLARICAAFSSGFGALQMWSYSAPHRFTTSLIRRSGLELHSWEHVDRDMTPEQDAMARVREQRPDIEVTGTLARPRLSMNPGNTVVAGSLAVVTGGISVLVRNVMDRLTTSGNVCAARLAKANEQMAEIEALN